MEESLSHFVISSPPKVSVTSPHLSTPYPWAQRFSGAATPPHRGNRPYPTHHCQTTSPILDLRPFHCCLPYQPNAHPSLIKPISLPNHLQRKTQLYKTQNLRLPLLPVAPALHTSQTSSSLHPLYLPWLLSNTKRLPLLRPSYQSSLCVSTCEIRWDKLPLHPSCSIDFSYHSRKPNLYSLTTNPNTRNHSTQYGSLGTLRRNGHSGLRFFAWSITGICTISRSVSAELSRPDIVAWRQYRSSLRWRRWLHVKWISKFGPRL